VGVAGLKSWLTTDKPTAANTEIDSAAANLIYGGHFFRHPYRVGQGQNVHRHSHPEPFRAGNDGSGDDVTVNTTWIATAGAHSLKVRIDPENTIDEIDTDNNDRAISVSVEDVAEGETNSTLKMAALVVVALVAGLAYVSYRSRRT